MKINEMAKEDKIASVFIAIVGVSLAISLWADYRGLSEHLVNSPAYVLFATGVIALIYALKYLFKKVEK